MRRFTALCLSVVLLSGCLSEPGSIAPADYAWQLPSRFNPPQVPASNPMSVAKVELGRHLFYDRRLSGNGQQSCADCHEQALAFTDGRTTALGSTGEHHHRNSQGLTNVAYNTSYTWASRALVTLEQQIELPLFGEAPLEMGITDHNEAQVLARLQAEPRYPALFQAAFPEADNPWQIGYTIQAMASFIRTLISGNSPWDRYRHGDYTQLSPAAERGMTLFFSEQMECFHCHDGFNFSQGSADQGSPFIVTPFHNTGLYNLDGAGALPPQDTGLHGGTGRPEDMGAFRAPTLRNVALTAPYMHDGSLADLDAVLDFYAAGGRAPTQVNGSNTGDGRRSPLKSGFVRGFALTDTQRNDLKAFLHSLTDERFIRDPAFSNPWPASSTTTAARPAD